MSYYTVEGRWEATRESVTEARYFQIEGDVSGLERAKRIAQEYLYRRAGRVSTPLEWVAGTNGKREAYYARTPAITFRITA